MAASPYGAPTSGSTSNRNTGAQAAQTAHIRKVLRAAGYNIRKNGPSTARLMNAWKDFHAHTSHRPVDSKKWNQTHGKLDAAAPSPEDNRTGRQVPHTSLPKGDNAMGRPNKKKPKGKPVGPKGGGGGNAGKSGKAGASAGSGKAGYSAGLKMIPEAMAKQIADDQFGGSIKLAKQAIAQNLAQTKGDISNIADWTKQVQTKLHEGDVSTQAAYAEAARQSAANAAALGQSQGGNVGSNLIRAEGLNAQNANLQMGASSHQGASEMQAIMEQAAAQAKQNEQNLGSQRNVKAQLQLQDYEGQRGALQGQTLMSILSQNNQLRQQNFQNTLSGLSTQAALAMSGAQLANLNVQTNLAKAQGDGSHLSWSQQMAKNPNMMMDLAQEAGIIDPKTGALLPQMNTNKAKDMLRNIMLSKGYGNAAGAIKTNKKMNAIQKRMLQSIIGNVQAAYARRNAIPPGQPGAPVPAQ